MTEKPLKLMAELISDFTNPGDVVLDPFCGLGTTTGVACVKYGRKFVGVGLDEKHFDTACRRLERELLKPSLFIAKPKLKKPNLFGKT